MEWYRKTKAKYRNHLQNHQCDSKQHHHQHQHLKQSMIMSYSSPKLSINDENVHMTSGRRRFSGGANDLCIYTNNGVLHDSQIATDGSSINWQLLSVTLHRVDNIGFGIAVSGGSDNPHCISGDSSIVVSDVVPKGPAYGLLKIDDRILSANGISLENADYGSAIKIMQESDHLNMIIKRRVPVPVLEFEQRTLKFTLSKSRKKEDFGIVLGCKYYIKEITNRKLAEKDPGLREGDIVLRINGQILDDVTFEEATKWLSKSREKLSLVVQRDIRRDSNSRWPSQNTVYERLGSVSGTPRHSPSPMHSCHHSIAHRSSVEGPSNFCNANMKYVQSDQNSSVDYGEYSKRKGSVSSQGQTECEVRTVRFRKSGGSLGVRVIGGNRVGIFISAVQEDSSAAHYSIKPGDRILFVNDKSMVGITREEAVRHLLSLNDEVIMRVEHAGIDFEQIQQSQLGDNFYIRTHFSHQKVMNQLELTFHNGDIFHITDTLFGGTIGLWQATRVYSVVDGNYGGSEANKGVIPNAETAERLAKLSQIDSSTIGRSTFFRRKLKERRTKSLTKNIVDDLPSIESTYDIVLPAYERVLLKQPAFLRPIILYGPLADIARHVLLTNFSLHFAGTSDENIVRLRTIDAAIANNKHCILDISPGSVERLQLAQYAPIVIFIDVDSRNRLRELRSKSGAPSTSLRKLIEQSQKIKKCYSYLLTATLDASKEDGWFDALRQLISHLQDRRVWIPEFKPVANLSDVVLFPMQNALMQSDSDVESSRGDYSGNSYVSREQIKFDKEGSIYRSLYDSYVDNGIYPRPSHYVQSHSRTGWCNEYNPLMGDINSCYQNVSQKSEMIEKIEHMEEVLKDRLDSRDHLSCAVDNHSPVVSVSLASTSTVDGYNVNAVVTPPRRCANNPSSLSTKISNFDNQNGRLTPSSVQCTNIKSNTLLANQGNEPGVENAPKTSVIICAETNTANPRSASASVPSVKNSKDEMTVGDAHLYQRSQHCSGFYDVKQILAEQSPDYYGADSLPWSNDCNTQNITAQNPSSPLWKQNQQSFNILRSGTRWQSNCADRRSPNVCQESSFRSSYQPLQSAISSSIDYKNGYQQRIACQTSGLASNSSPRQLELENALSRNQSGAHETKSMTNFDEQITQLIDDDAIKDVEVHDEPTVIEHVSSVIDCSGGTINCPQSGVMLIIPSGAVNEGVQQEIYVKVCCANSEHSRPPLDESREESLMSPLVMCGPQDLKFNIPVELRLPHSASNSGGNWIFALKSGTGEKWNQLSLDGNTSSVVTDHFVSVKIEHF